MTSENIYQLTHPTNPPQIRSAGRDEPSIPVVSRVLEGSALVPCCGNAIWLPETGCLLLHCRGLYGSMLGLLGGTIGEPGGTKRLRGRGGRWTGVAGVKGYGDPVANVAAEIGVRKC